MKGIGQGKTKFVLDKRRKQLYGNMYELGNFVRRRTLLGSR